MSGLRFECTRCGRCCTNHGDYAHVYLSGAEVRALARYLDLPLEDFERRYTFVDEDGWTQLQLAGDRCVFLQVDGGCGVYGARPTQCRTFPFWREFVVQGRWTEEVRGVCEGIGSGKSWSAEEVERLMIQMEESHLDD